MVFRDVPGWRRASPGRLRLQYSVIDVPQHRTFNGLKYAKQIEVERKKRQESSLDRLGGSAALLCESLVFIFEYTPQI